MRKKKTVCSRCGIEPLRAGGGRYCNGCHAANMREWRKTHRLEGEALKRATARSYLHVYIKRGRISKGPCAICGVTQVQAHHHDYDKPLEVVWLCKQHHGLIHGKTFAAENA